MDSQPADSTSGQYVVVARRYRPQVFDELIGQQVVARALCNAIDTSRVGHAYLFTGARGVGKTSAARILAKALNCVDGPTPTPCNKCDICDGVSAGDDVDVLEIDGASNRGIDEIRQLRANVNVRPSRSRFKIYIIDEVHMLTREAFNALLKTLEEPPDHVKFVFCTTDPEKIPITVLSRCQRFDFAPVEVPAIAERLQQIVQAEGATAEPEALHLLARRAAGSMRDSQSLLEQLLSFGGKNITVDGVHDMLGTARSGRLHALANFLSQRDAAGALKELDEAVLEGVDVGQVTVQLLGHFRDLMVATVGGPRDLMLHTAESEFDETRTAAGAWGLQTVLAAIQILDQAVIRMRQSTHVRILAELALVRICHLDDLDALPDLIAGLRTGQSASSLPTTRGPAQGKVPAKKKLESVNSRPSASLGRESSDETVAKGSPRTQVEPQEEGEPSSDTPAPSAQNTCEPLTSESAQQIWCTALQQLDDMTSEFGSRFSHVAISAPNRLVIYFSSKYNSSKLYCERSEQRSRLEQQLARVAGQPVGLDFQIIQDPEPPELETKSASPRQRTREIRSNPIVQQAMELFGAELVKVDDAQRGDPRPRT